VGRGLPAATTARLGAEQADQAFSDGRLSLTYGFAWGGNRSGPQDDVTEQQHLDVPALGSHLIAHGEVLESHRVCVGDLQPAVPGLKFTSAKRW
jgi:hypothetical protein